MKRAALLFALAATAACAQQLDPTITIARIPAYLLRQSQAALSPASDAIQVWVAVPNLQPAIAEVTLKYDTGTEAVSVVSARRLVAGFDIHSFAVSASTVRIVSISVSVAPITTTKEFPGDF